MATIKSEQGADKEPLSHAETVKLLEELSVSFDNAGDVVSAFICARKAKSLKAGQENNEAPD